MVVAKFAVPFVLFCVIFSRTGAITCYECTSGQGQDCKYTGSTCAYGLFGCMKMAIYSGGVDKLGNFYNEESKIVSMARGCTFLPIGGVDACQQSVFAGFRMVTCYCFSDYCNAAGGSRYSSRTILFSIAFLVVLRGFL